MFAACRHLPELHYFISFQRLQGTCSGIKVICFPFQSVNSHFFCNGTALLPFFQCTWIWFVIPIGTFTAHASVIEVIRKFWLPFRCANSLYVLRLSIPSIKRCEQAPLRKRDRTHANVIDTKRCFFVFQRLLFRKVPKQGHRPAHLR